LVLHQSFLLGSYTRRLDENPSKTWVYHWMLMELV
jgi:hypothetical protein